MYFKALVWKCDKKSGKGQAENELPSDVREENGHSQITGKGKISLSGFLTWDIVMAKFVLGFGGMGIWKNIC